MKKPIKICFIGNQSLHFVKKDIEILQKNFEIIVIDPSNFKLNPVKYLFTINKTIKKCDISFSWFADRYVAIAIFFSKLYGKKSIVVAGGYDIAYAPEIKYGAFTKIKEKIPAKYVFKNSDLIIAISKYVEKEIYKRVKPKKVKLIYNGVETNFKLFKEKEKNIVTIGRLTKNGIVLKGLEIFSKVSLSFPDYKFIIIGPSEEKYVNMLKEINPKLIFTGQLSHEKVIKFLLSAKVYCQLSFIESFGISVAESMVCRCIPVVTKKGGIPEIVGKNGFYVDYNDKKSTTNAIKKAIETKENFFNNEIDNIRNLFSYEKREKELVKTIEEILKI